MHLAYTRIFDDQAVEALDLIQLHEGNPYGLAAGYYLIHDLHPISAAQGPDLYFVVEAMISHTILLTAWFQASSGQLFLSPEHLQSTQAEAALMLLRSRLADTRVSLLLQERQTQVKLAQLAMGKPAEAALVVTPENQALTTTKDFTGSLVLRIELQGSLPRIWRRIQVPADFILDQLHEVIQTAMGWENSHLWSFSNADGENFGPSVDAFWDEHSGSERLPEVLIGDLMRAPKETLDYTYNFDDSWEHLLVVEKLLQNRTGPLVLAGEKACPPEDAGGIHSYQEMLKVYKKKLWSESDREILEFLGPDFMPDLFDLETANQRLAKIIHTAGHSDSRS